MVDSTAPALLEADAPRLAHARARATAGCSTWPSTAGFQPGPYMATYYATKAFVVVVGGASARAEGHGRGRRTCHCPGRHGVRAARGDHEEPLVPAPAWPVPPEVVEHAYGMMMRGGCWPSMASSTRWPGFMVRFSPRAGLQQGPGVAAGLNQQG